MSDLLIQAMSAKQSGDINLAKQLLSQAIVQNPRNEAAWMLMADVVDDVKLRRNCLERVLSINPDNQAASTALTKLNTNPLEAIMRGERNKPLDTPKNEKTPPFTPPFTWDEKPEQYLALGDLTFPDIPDEEANPLPETPLTFDWANESDEPDKTIDKIFEAVSKPELASELPPEKEASWLDSLRPDEAIVEQPEDELESEETKTDDPWLKELVSSNAEETEVEGPPTEDDFSVSAEPELGLQAFTTNGNMPQASAEPGSLLWDNPHAKADRLVILSYRSLIYAHPTDADMPEILRLFNENRMVRDLLGENAHLIKLETIERVTANPKEANLVIEHKPNGKLITHQFHFSSQQARDEVLAALRFRLGAGFTQSSHTISLEDKILTPILLIIFIGVLAWVLIWGVPWLNTVAEQNSGSPLVMLSNLQQLVTQFGVVYILLLAGLIVIACAGWMVLNLRKPSREVILKR